MGRLLPFLKKRNPPPSPVGVVPDNATSSSSPPPAEMDPIETKVTPVGYAPTRRRKAALNAFKSALDVVGKSSVPFIGVAVTFTLRIIKGLEVSVNQFK
ncbi:hypothetical protein M422DRAFT_259564 [Sphaerobolus stellatus SS14]|uniref:Uncharacterized protein n=1 Tax=Sphaerobolus stellatus (strain SS14) TaxID=990650 RepID=A0A0C9VJV5_SPHS4|nr:hypothetical protein M422DRAFT_259564 [Sphaerobolus stellatus SS14]